MTGFYMKRKTELKWVKCFPVCFNKNYAKYWDGLDKYRCVFRIQWKIYEEAFCENSEQLKVINYF